MTSDINEEHCFYKNLLDLARKGKELPIEVLCEASCRAYDSESKSGVELLDLVYNVDYHAILLQYPEIVRRVLADRTPILKQSIVDKYRHQNEFVNNDVSKLWLGLVALQAKVDEARGCTTKIIVTKRTKIADALQEFVDMIGDIGVNDELWGEYKEFYRNVAEFSKIVYTGAAISSVQYDTSNFPEMLKPCVELVNQLGGKHAHDVWVNPGEGMSLKILREKLENIKAPIERTICDLLFIDSWLLASDCIEISDQVSVVDSQLQHTDTNIDQGAQIDSQPNQSNVRNIPDARDILDISFESDLGAVDGKLTMPLSQPLPKLIVKPKADTALWKVSASVVGDTHINIRLVDSNREDMIWKFEFEFTNERPAMPSSFVIDFGIVSSSDQNEESYRTTVHTVIPIHLRWRDADWLPIHPKLPGRELLVSGVGGLGGTEKCGVKQVYEKLTGCVKSIHEDGKEPALIWFCGAPASGKTTLLDQLADELNKHETNIVVRLSGIRIRECESQSISINRHVVDRLKAALEEKVTKSTSIKSDVRVLTALISNGLSPNRGWDDVSTTIVKISDILEGVALFILFDEIEMIQNITNIANMMSFTNSHILKPYLLQQNSITSSELKHSNPAIMIVSDCATFDLRLKDAKLFKTICQVKLVSFFSVEQIRELLEKLPPSGKDSSNLASRIWLWTHGHPILTNALIDAYLNGAKSGKELNVDCAAISSEIVRTTISHLVKEKRWEDKDGRPQSSQRIYPEGQQGDLMNLMQWSKYCIPIIAVYK